MDKLLREKLSDIRKRLALAKDQSKKGFIPCKIYADQWRNSYENQLTLPSIDRLVTR
jgi:hypothetical protein